ncbi:ABC transporter substrate-binding protein [Kribbella sp. NPDC004875]|uniref:ABC transporter substrate-binding protein n=1 Tax=Kribbella sp. NPDC004875 TaxID=3364107 RepID=UPI003693D2CB
MHLSHQPSHRPALTRRHFLGALGGLAVATSIGTASGCGQEVSPRAAIALPTGLWPYTGPALTKQRITLRVLRQQFPIKLQDQYFTKLFAQFTAAYPNLRIEDQTVPFGELSQKAQLAIAGGSPPDIILTFGDFMPEYVANNAAVPLDDLIARDFIEDIVAPTRTLHSHDGKLYAMPWEQQILAHFYNADVFAKYGVEAPPVSDDPADAWTWDRTRDAWRELEEAQRGKDGRLWSLAPSIMGPGGPGSSYWFEGIFLRSAGARNGTDSERRTFEAVSPDGTSARGYVDTPEAVAGMQYYQSLFTDRLTPRAGLPNAWYDGRAVSFINADTTALRAQQLKVKFRWAVAPVPAGKTQFSHGSGAAFFVASASRHIPEAAALLAFLHNDTNRMSWHTDVRGTLPARKSLFERLPRYRQHPYKLMLNTLEQCAYPPPATPGALSYQYVLNSAIKDIALGAAPDERLTHAATKLETLLARYR